MALPDAAAAGAASLSQLDKLIHEPARLSIMATLYVVKSGDFLFVMRQTGLTFGNLSSHLSKLEAAGYVRIVKEFKGRKPHTMLFLTEEGRTAFTAYRESMTLMLDSLPS